MLLVIVGGVAMACVKEGKGEMLGRDVMIVGGGYAGLVGWGVFVLSRSLALPINARWYGLMGRGAFVLSLPLSLSIPLSLSAH